MNENETRELLKSLKQNFRNTKNVSAVFTNSNNEKLHVIQTFQDFYDFYIFQKQKQKEGYLLESCCIIPAEKKPDPEKQKESVINFIKANCELLPEVQTPIKDIYNIFKNQNPDITQIFFTKTLFSNFSGISRKQKRVGTGNPIQIFIGIRLKEKIVNLS